MFKMNEDKITVMDVSITFSVQIVQTWYDMSYKIFSHACLQHSQKSTVM